MCQTAASFLAILAAALWLTSHAFAQSPSDAERWSRFKALPIGSQIRVELKQGDRLAGMVEEFDRGRLTLRDRAGKSVVVEQDAVSRVTRKSRRRGALYGFIVGFGAGFVTGAAAGPYIVDFGDPGAARRAKYGAGWGGFFGGVGAGIGALIGAGVTVYP